jgi:DNA invertase Pin-like site-specific DNA recombinase
MTQAIVYARVSTDDQDCTRQVSELTAWAARLGYNVAAVVTEKASGTRDDRRERRGIIEAAKRRTFDVVLVSELSRWSRSTLDLILTLETLHASGVAVRALNGFDFDISTPHGRMLASVLGSLAQFERDMIAMRVKSGLVEARRKGVKLGRPPGKTGMSLKPAKRAMIETLLIQGDSLRTISAKCGAAVNTIRKVQSALNASKAQNTIEPPNTP